MAVSLSIDDGRIEDTEASNIELDGNMEDVAMLAFSKLIVLLNSKDISVMGTLVASLLEEAVRNKELRFKLSAVDGVGNLAECSLDCNSGKELDIEAAKSLA